MILFRSETPLPDHSKNVILFQHKILFAIQFELGAAILGEQDAITLAYIQRCAVAIVQQSATADSDHSSLLGLLFSGVRNYDAALGDFLFSSGLYDHTVANRMNLCHD